MTSVKEETLLPVLRVVREARTELVGGEPDGAARCTELLRIADRWAGELPAEVLDDPDTLQSITAVRTQIRTCLIAADQLVDAGVASNVVADVLSRGTTAASQALVMALYGHETVGATP
jgi:hypothetical protein